MKPRTRRVQRALEDLIRSPDGKVSEAKAWANVGKLICVFLLLWHTTDVIAHYEFAMVLLAFLIAPDLVKKMLAMRLGGTTETRSSSSSEEVTVTKRKKNDNA